MKVIAVEVSNKKGGTKTILLDTSTIKEHRPATHGTSLCGHLTENIPATRIILNDGTRFKAVMPHEVFVAEMAKAGQARVFVRTIEHGALPWKPGYEPQPDAATTTDASESESE